MGSRCYDSPAFLVERHRMIKTSEPSQCRAPQSLYSTACPDPVLSVWADEQDPPSTRWSQQPPSSASTPDPKSVPRGCNLPLLHTASKTQPRPWKHARYQCQEIRRRGICGTKSAAPITQYANTQHDKKALVATVAHN